MSEAIITNSLRAQLGKGEYVPVQGRGNSKVGLWRGSETYFIKQYPDDRNWKRRESEKNAIDFYLKNGITSIPKVICSNEELNYSAFSHINGVSNYTPDQNIEQQFAAFLSKINSITGAESYPGLAKEAFFNSAELKEHITRRLSFLKDIPDEMLQDYLKNHVEKYFSEIGFYELADFSCDSKIIVSPSDFGTHNSLFGWDGNVYFIDFEYAGRDSLFKLFGDIYWHVGSNFSTEQRMELISPYLPGASDREIFRKVCLLMGLKWSLLLLNEFIPSNLNKRIAATSSILNIEQIKSEQLDKSKNILKRTANEWYR